MAPEIRLMQPGEERQWITLNTPPDEVEDRYRQFQERRQAYPEDPTCFVVAAEGERLVAKLRGSLVRSDFYLIQAVTVNQGYDYDEIGRQLLAFALRQNRIRSVEAVNWDRPEDAANDALLRRCGFAPFIEKVLVRRSLEDLKQEGTDPMIYQTFRQAGRDRFIEALAGVNVINPNRDANTTDPARDLGETVDQSGSAFDPDQWLLAFLGEELAGFILPQVFPDSPQEGTMFNLGLMPRFRGRGLGTILHTRGFVQLVAAGATSYVDSTDVLNQPMRRIFAAQGCYEVGVRRLYRHVGTNRAT